MTQMSYWWSTSGTPAGDQVASYSQAHLSKIVEILASCSGFEGVAPSYLSELACSANGANTVAVAAGGAVVDGKPYLNDASVDVNIPSAVGGGNTRIDRLVLRASWAGFDIAITRIAGTDAASPTAPAITQTTGTTYDIQLCQVLVDTSGAVTVTDERVFAQGGTNSLSDDAVTTAKLNDEAVTLAKLAADSVDDTKAGNRVPQFYRRQGGDATGWSTYGTTDYTPTTVRMQGGAARMASAGNAGSLTVNLPVAFSALGILFAQPHLADSSATSARNIACGCAWNSVSAFTINWKTIDGASLTTDVIFFWLAIGPE